MVSRYVRLLFLGIVFVSRSLYASSDEAQIYFNAGTEKYLQGQFTAAVDNLEKAQALEPGNRKIKEFMVKILLEAATQGHLNHNYRQAFEYLKKAQKISPENAKVNEMYQLTSDLINVAPEPPAKREEKVARVMPEREREAAPQKSATRNTAPKKEKVITVPASPSVETGTPGHVKDTRSFAGRYPEATVAYALGVTFFSLLFLGAFQVKSSWLKKARAQLKEVEEKAGRLEEDKSALVIEMARLKERERYEHETIEELRRELKDRTRKEEERIRAELELRTRHIEEKLRAEMPGTGRKNSAREAFLHQQQAKFFEFLGDSSNIDELSSPAIESTRERIAIMAENLYEYAPGAAIDFLEKMAQNENALIRANVVSALVRIARRETLEIMLRLYADPDFRVKREVLKNLKHLNEKMSARVLFLDEQIQQRIKSIIDKEKTQGEWII